VVITGAGIITALGNGWEANAAGFRTGRSAFRPITLFDPARHRVKMAAEVDLPVQFPPCGLPLRVQRRMDRAARLLFHAAFEAWSQSGWNPGGQMPLVLGTTSGGMGLGEVYYEQTLHQPVHQRRQADRGLHYQPQRQGLDLQTAFHFSGPIVIVSNACASGANAIGHAWQLVRRGQADRVFTGGYDAISRMVFSGFDALQALSPTRCRPFDAARDGLGLGEGAAMLALESLETARSRGAQILGEIVGYGAATDIHHLTQPQPQGEAALQSMSAACATAGLVPSQIGYLNAHGTGTPLNDSAEAMAINRWAGEVVTRLPVSSTKGTIGHLLGAAGAVEAVVCLMALQGQWLPPNAGLHTPDPICRFPIPATSQQAVMEYAASNSFGFGGANATLILRRWS
jgi:3-oxoacyl-[acyl-carrier-protein] synthase II